MDLSDKLVTTSGEKESHDFSFSSGPRYCSAEWKKTYSGSPSKLFGGFFCQGAGVGVIRDEIGEYISLLYGTPVRMSQKETTK